ncbi:MAG: hypothetical protein DSY57_06875 [Desulfobulbus sp.]|nr:MAG: hypothetical protein DSY57_06875 [Desulfobulbus sp.]
MEYSEIISQNVTLFFSGLLAAMILALALEEKLHAKKSIIVGTFAIVCLLIASGLGIIPFGDIILPGGHKLHMPVYIEAVDWEVIAIIIGSSLFVDVISRSGLFSWVAIKLTKMSAGDPLKLLWYYGLMTVLFSAVLNNVTAMIIVGSLTAVSLDKLGHQSKLLGFLLIEGLLTNIGGLLTLISSVPNISVLPVFFSRQVPMSPLPRWQPCFSAPASLIFTRFGLPMRRRRPPSWSKVLTKMIPSTVVVFFCLPSCCWLCSSV